MKKSTKQRLVYFFCEGCGCIQPTRQRGQEAILRNFQLLDPNDQDNLDLVVLVPEPAPEPAPEPEKRKKRSWLDNFINGDDDE
jgi:hypothetical protein